MSQGGQLAAVNTSTASNHVGDGITINGGGGGHLNENENGNGGDHHQYYKAQVAGEGEGKKGHGDEGHGEGVHGGEGHHDHKKHHHKRLKRLNLNWRAKLFLTFEEPEYSYTARFISACLNACIFLSVIVFIMGTMGPFQHIPHECESSERVGYSCYNDQGQVTRVESEEHVRPHHHHYQAATKLPHRQLLTAMYHENRGKQQQVGGGEAEPYQARIGEQHRHLLSTTYQQQQQQHRELLFTMYHRSRGQRQQQQELGGGGGGGKGLHLETAAEGKKEVSFVEEEGRAEEKAEPPKGKGEAAGPKKGEGESEVAVLKKGEEGGESHGIREGGNDEPEALGGEGEEGGHEEGSIPLEAGEAYCEMICEPVATEEIEVVEMFAMVLFTLDYLIRLLCVHAVPFSLLHPEEFAKNRSKRHHKPNGFMKTIHYFFELMNIIDLLALAPYYFRTVIEKEFPGFAATGARGVLRVIRLLRIFRIAPFYMHMVVSTHGIVKSSDTPHCCRFDLSWLFNTLRLGDYAEGAPLFFTTLRASYPAIIVFLLSVFMFVVCMGTFMYMSERGRFQVTPDFLHGAFLVRNMSAIAASGEGVKEVPHAKVEGAHSNIFISMLYVISDVSTMPSICFLTPMTAIGKLVNVGIDYMALLVLTMPIAIVARNFHEQYNAFFGAWELEEYYWSDDELWEDASEVDSREEEGEVDRGEEGEMDEKKKLQALEDVVAKLLREQTHERGMGGTIRLEREEEGDEEAGGAHRRRLSSASYMVGEGVGEEVEDDTRGLMMSRRRGVWG